jgi:cysteine desulfurase
MIYLDYAANTPVEKEVLDLYYDVTLKYYANPNSNHKLGKEAKEVIDNCSKEILEDLHLTNTEVIYTSGATETNNLVIKGICERYKNFGKHIIISSLEHNSIISSANIMQEQGFDVDLLPVTKEGLIDINALKSLLREDTILVSICAVDSELGLIQQVEEIKDILKDYSNTYFHTDASQAIGKTDINYDGIDLITIAPHKFYGPNGIGILLKRDNVSIKPIIHGGRSTTVFRSGTPVLPDIYAATHALTKAVKNQKERTEYVKELNKLIIDHLSTIKEIHINNTPKSIPYTINFSIKGVKSQDVADMLEEKEIYVSTKTSCCPPESPSKLVYALTKDKQLATSSIRVSLSHLTTKEEINIFLKGLDKCIEELRNNGKI